MNKLWKTVNSLFLWGKVLGFALGLGVVTGLFAGIIGMLVVKSMEGAIAVGAVVGIGFTVFTARFAYRAAIKGQEDWQEEQAQAWISAGGTDAEKARRRAVWRDHGWVAVATALAALKPSAGGFVAGPEFGLNIDGSPMVNGVDINGNPFGVTYNPAADTLVFSDNAYSPPLHHDH